MVRLAAAVSLGLLLGVALSAASVASADVAPPNPQPTPTSRDLMGALSAHLDQEKRRAANAPRDGLASGWTEEDAGPPGATGASGSSGSGASGSSSSGGPNPADTSLQHDLPTEADLEASLPERRAKAQASLASHLSAMIGDKTVDAALTDELRRHARVIARLDRIGFVASEQKDDDAMKRVTALLSEEFELHAREVDRWLGKP